MKHADHVNLLKPANLAPGGTWADLGAGSGAFTLALREIVGADAHIYAVDKDSASLRELQDAYRKRFSETSSLSVVHGDFSSALDLPPLDGALMANSLHFFSDDDKLPLLGHVGSCLKPGGALLLVEYNVDRGNMWVPHPLSFETWRTLARRAGFSEPHLLATHPSNFLRQFYSALCYRG